MKVNGTKKEVHLLAGGRVSKMLQSESTKALNTLYLYFVDGVKSVKVYCPERR
jgi:hypothetical protein